MKISDNIDLIDGTNANVYVIKTEKKIIQIDTGMKNNLERILNYYEANRTRPDIIFITHYHMDHIGTLSSLQGRFNPMVIASETEREYLEGRAVPEKPKSLLGKMVMTFSAKMNFQGISTCEKIEDENLQCVATPGHTPGSISLLMRRERVIFIGDAAATKDGELKTIGAFTLDPETAERSLEKIRALKPIKILPGHGDPLNLE